MKILIKFFAIVGVLSTMYFMFDFVRLQAESSKYLRNCEQVKVGMNILEAKKIMGDDEYWKKASRSEIWMFFQQTDSTYEYMLAYPSPFGASTGTDIYFDTQTGKVKRVVCGE